jgi:hypothetical protein
MYNETRGLVNKAAIFKKEMSGLRYIFKWGQSGFRKGFKVLISHRFPSKFDIAKTSNERGCGIYDYQQAYRKIA